MEQGMSWESVATAATEFATACGDRFYLSRDLTLRLGSVKRVSLLVDTQTKRAALIPDSDGYLLSKSCSGVVVSARKAIAKLRLEKGDRLNYTGTEEINGRQAFILEVERA